MEYLETLTRLGVVHFRLIAGALLMLNLDHVQYIRCSFAILCLVHATLPRLGASFIRSAAGFMEGVPPHLGCISTRNAHNQSARRRVSLAHVLLGSSFVSCRLELSTGRTAKAPCEDGGPEMW